MAASSVNIACDSSSSNHVKADVSTVSVDLDCDVDMDAKPKDLKHIIIGDDEDLVKKKYADNTAEAS